MEDIMNKMFKKVGGVFSKKLISLNESSTDLREEQDKKKDVKSDSRRQRSISIR